MRHTQSPQHGGTARRLDSPRRAPGQAWTDVVRAWLRRTDGRWPARVSSFLLALTLAIGLPELLARGFLAA